MAKKLNHKRCNFCNEISIENTEPSHCTERCTLMRKRMQDEPNDIIRKFKGARNYQLLAMRDAFTSFLPQASDNLSVDLLNTMIGYCRIEIDYRCTPTKI